MASVLPLVLPFIGSQNVDLFALLQQQVQKLGSNPQEQTDSSNAVSQMRIKVFATSPATPGYRKDVSIYLAYLRIVEARFPTIQGAFRYLDPFDRKTYFQTQNLSFEKIVVMFNIASALTYEAASLPTDGANLKQKAKLYKFAASYILRIEKQLPQCLVSQPPPYVNRMVLKAIQLMLLGKAEENFYLMVALSNMAGDKKSKVAVTTAKFFTGAIKALNEGILETRAVFNPNLINILSYCEIRSHGFAAQDLSSMYVQELDYGTKVTYMRIVLRCMSECISKLQIIVQSRDNSLITSGGSEQLQRLQQEFSKFDSEREKIETDVRTIFYQRIPDENELAPFQEYNQPITYLPDTDLDRDTEIPITRPKVLPQPEPAPASGQPPTAVVYLDRNIYESLISRDLLLKRESFQKQVDALVTQVDTLGRQVTSETREEIERLKMAELVQKAVEKADGPKIGKETVALAIPDDLANLIKQTRDQQGYTKLYSLYQDVERKYHGCEQVNQSIRQQLNDAINQARSGQNNQYTYNQQNNLNLLTNEATQFDDHLEKAHKVDKEVMQRIVENHPTLEIIEKYEVVAVVYAEVLRLVQNEGAGQTVSAMKLSPAVLREHADALKLALDTFQTRENDMNNAINQLKSKAGSVDIITKLNQAQQQGSAVDVVTQELLPLNQLAAAAKTSIESVKSMMPNIRELHKILDTDLGAGNSTDPSNEQVSKLLKKATTSFVQIRDHLNNGSVFYDALQQRLNDFQARVSAQTRYVLPPPQ